MRAKPRVLLGKRRNNLTNIETFDCTVLEVQRDRCFCLFEGREVLAELRLGDENDIPTVGDEATLERVGDEFYLTRIAPRRSCFYRRATDPNVLRRQPVAANFDYVFIVQALGHDFNLARLERYLTAAWASGGTPVVLLTKADTSGDAASVVADASAVAVGAEVHAVSALTGEGMSALDRYFAEGKTVALLGSSGVGKSTLVNVVAGTEVMATGAVREFDERGRHTTTYRRMILLPNGSRVIDTPGMRSLGLVETDGLDAAFPDVEAALARGCRFADCRHSGEPGCAIDAALADGSLDRERWERYRKLSDEAERVERGIEKHAAFKEHKKSKKFSAKRNRSAYFEED